MRKYSLFIVFIVTILTLFLSNIAGALVPTPAPDSTSSGSHEVASAEYRFPAAVYEEVLSDRKTEAWAKVFYPKDFAIMQGKAPIIFFLHGNHATCGTGSNPRIDSSCSYTDSGFCPAGFVVVPNHEGYNYLAKNLASWGYVVVSINANRGITCGDGVKDDFGLNLARGRLVLKHLHYFYLWATQGGAPLSLGLGEDGLLGKIDFSEVGLLGHSRGGEGVRAAYNLYSDHDSPWRSKIPGLSIKAIYEIGAVDGQTSRVLDANGTVWNQLLPMCDGDVADLEGRFPFERMLLNKSESADSQKSLYQVWGANHNFFNTEWQSSDSDGCFAGAPIFDPDGSYSRKQQKIALASVPAFFRSHLGPEAKAHFNQNFNPIHALPNVVASITQIDRDFTPSPGQTETTIVEDFDRATGKNSSGYTNLASGISIDHRYLEKQQRAALISWDTTHQASFQPGFFEAVWAPLGQGNDIHDFATLDFRISRKQDKLNTEATTDFGIVLEDYRGNFSNEVRVSNYALINGPGNYETILQTVRIPLFEFKGVDLTRIYGVKFVFDQTASGALYFANIRVHRNFGLGAYEKVVVTKPLYTIPKVNAMKLAPQYVPAKLNSIRSVRVIKASRAFAGQSTVEISVASEVPFTVRNQLPVLEIGDKKFTLSRYSDPKELKELTFTLTEKEYQQVSKTAAVQLTNGKIWKFESLARQQVK